MPARQHDLKVVAEGFSFLEGPRWRDGRLYVSDFYLHQVFAISETGEAEPIVEVPAQPSGLGFTPDGALLVVSMGDQKLMRFKDGALSEAADLSALTGSLCNDMYVDPAGRAYVGNFGWDPAATQEISPTCLIGVSPDGQVSKAADGLVFPNGVVKDPTGSRLLVAETFAGRVSAFDVAADGSLSNRAVWADFAGRSFATVPEALEARVVLPDGMAADAEGRLWIGQAGGSRAVLAAEGGEILDFVDVAPLTPYAVALGGADRRTLFICAAVPLDPEVDPANLRSAKLLACRVEVPGA